jgi:hypothetical protein
MASQISFSSIDENYPVAGQDNDTQGFRDNFNVIKQALLKASEEVTTLQNNTAGLELSALDGDVPGTNFNNTFLTGAVLRGNTESLISGGNISGNDIPLDFENGNYQVFKVEGGNISFDITGFSDTDDGANRMIVELTGDDFPRSVSFGSSNPGIINFKTSNFPYGAFTVSDSTDPVLIEIYTRKKNSEPGVLARVIFIKYLGFFEAAPDNIPTIPVLTLTQRNALPAARVGMLIFNTTDQKIQVCSSISPQVVWTNA